jgi:hypothetical protein
VTGCVFAIVQVDSADVDRDWFLTDGRLGVINPVNMDGFYSDRIDANSVANFMAEERPDLETFLVQVVEKVSGHKAGK